MTIEALCAVLDDDLLQYWASVCSVLAKVSQIHSSSLTWANLHNASLFNNALAAPIAQTLRKEIMNHLIRLRVKRLDVIVEVRPTGECVDMLPQSEFALEFEESLGGASFDLTRHEFLSNNGLSRREKFLHLGELNFLPHKAVIIAGESGAGKTYYAARRLRYKLFDATTDDIAVFYTKARFYSIRLYEQDLRSEDMAVRNAAALKFLDELWGDCERNYSESQTIDLLEVSVLVVIDEIGSFPWLVRAVASCLPLFEHKLQSQVKQLRVAMVGTAVDWAITVDETKSFKPLGIPSESDLNYSYLLIRIIPWKEKILKDFWHFHFKRVFPDGNTASHCLDAASSIDMFKILGQNARCALFLANEICSVIRGWNQKADGQAVARLICEGRALIFLRAAQSYGNTNSIGNLRTEKPNQFKVHMIRSLNYVLKRIPSALEEPDDDDDDGDDDDDDDVRLAELLQFGVLFMDQGNRIHMSPAFLVLVLSSFGARQIPVYESSRFEDIVALRALAEILMLDFDAAVSLVRLRNPVPHTRANDTCLRKNVGEVVYDLDTTLPPDELKIIQDIFDNVETDNYQIIINGPNAAAPDVLVIEPNKRTLGDKRGSSIWLLQAKYSTHVHGWDNVGDCMEEVRKLGCEDSDLSHPVTCEFLKQLAAERRETIKRQIITSHGTR